MKVQAMIISKLEKGKGNGVQPSESMQMQVVPPMREMEREREIIIEGIGGDFLNRGERREQRGEWGETRYSKLALPSIPPLLPSPPILRPLPSPLTI